LPVDLVRPAGRSRRLAAVAAAHGMQVLDDAAQAFGASYKGRKLGSVCTTTATSFFPAKPLGCYGDGGAVLTDDDDLAACVKSLRVHGQGADKYDAERIGITGRLDTIQAAILLEKLKIFPDEIAARNVIAKRYEGGSPLRDAAARRQRINLGLGAIYHPAAAGTP
jgi:dTDP-4-amino-4,6-dideoxygalactose transaminase